MPGNGQLRFQDDEDDDGLRADVPDVLGLHDAQLRHGHAHVSDVLGDVHFLCHHVRIDGEGQRNDDGLREDLPPLRRPVHADGYPQGRLVRYGFAEARGALRRTILSSRSKKYSPGSSDEPPARSASRANLKSRSSF